jgi:hypothetical protein
VAGAATNPRFAEDIISRELEVEKFAETGGAAGIAVEVAIKDPDEFGSEGTSSAEPNCQQHL